MRTRLCATHEPAGTSAAGAPSSRAEVQHASVRRMRLLARAPQLLAVTFVCWAGRDGGATDRRDCLPGCWVSLRSGEPTGTRRAAAAAAVWSMFG